MKFYHFTKMENLFGIAAYGLFLSTDTGLTLGTPCVWLTRQHALSANASPGI
jgi:hypothetical protein